MSSSLLIYGSYGYTGALIAEEAHRRGWQPVLAGRNAQRVAAQADALGLDYCVFELDDVRLIRENIRDVQVVLHCAGPFNVTAEPMVQACLQAGVHYLDITGEIPVFEQLARYHDEAVERKVMVLPGTGFDVFPSDCLALHLKQLLPTATQLTLAVEVRGGYSRGTAITALGRIGEGGRVCRGGRLVQVPAGHGSLRVDFGAGPRRAASVPLADVYTAHRSTGIPDVETFLRGPPAVMWGLRAQRSLGWLLRMPWVQRFLQARIEAGPIGPDEAARARGGSRIWGRVRDGEERQAESRLQGPDPYTLTVRGSLLMVEKILAGCVVPGFQTPAAAFGPQVVLELEGIEGFEDLQPGPSHDASPLP